MCNESVTCKERREKQYRAAHFCSYMTEASVYCISVKSDSGGQMKIESVWSHRIAFCDQAELTRARIVALSHCYRHSP